MSILRTSCRELVGPVDDWPHLVARCRARCLAGPRDVARRESKRPAFDCSEEALDVAAADESVSPLLEHLLLLLLHQLHAERVLDRVELGGIGGGPGADGRDHAPAFDGVDAIENAGLALVAHGLDQRRRDAQVRDHVVCRGERARRLNLQAVLRQQIGGRAAGFLPSCQDGLRLLAPQARALLLGDELAGDVSLDVIQWHVRGIGDCIDLEQDQALVGVDDLRDVARPRSQRGAGELGLHGRFGDRAGVSAILSTQILGPTPGEHLEVGAPQGLLANLLHLRGQVRAAGLRHILLEQQPVERERARRAVQARLVGVVGGLDLIGIFGQEIGDLRVAHLHRLGDVGIQQADVVDGGLGCDAVVQLSHLGVGHRHPGDDDPAQLVAQHVIADLFFEPALGQAHALEGAAIHIDGELSVVPLEYFLFQHVALHLLGTDLQADAVGLLHHDLVHDQLVEHLLGERSDLVLVHAVLAHVVDLNTHDPLKVRVGDAVVVDGRHGLGRHHPGTAAHTPEDEDEDDDPENDPHHRAVGARSDLLHDGHWGTSGRAGLSPVRGAYGWTARCTRCPPPLQAAATWGAPRSGPCQGAPGAGPIPHHAQLEDVIGSVRRRLVRAAQVLPARPGPSPPARHLLPPAARPRSALHLPPPSLPGLPHAQLDAWDPVVRSGHRHRHVPHANLRTRAWRGVLPGQRRGHPRGSVGASANPARRRRRPRHVGAHARPTSMSFSQSAMA